MDYGVVTAKSDFTNLSLDEFFEKYYLGNQCWYIENYLNHKGHEFDEYYSLFKDIVATSVGITPEDIFMIGSAKNGFSLSPTKEGEKSKLFEQFDGDGLSRKKSDIDIAIVSAPIFEHYWKLYRDSYRMRYESIYKNHIIVETYRGFINEKNVRLIQETRSDWNRDINPVKAKLQIKVGFRHEINFRVYHSLVDFKDYSASAIKKIQKEISNEVI